jgi:hypothetical protein
VSVPWFSTWPEAPELLVKRRLPAAKSAFEISSVLATRPPTLMLEPAANRMPAALTRNTWPLALSWP